MLSYQEIKKHRNQKKYLFWVVVTSFLIHALLLLLFLIYGFQGNSFAQLKELFAQQEKDQPVIVFFPDEKIEKKEALQANNQPEIQQDTHQQESEPPIAVIPISAAQLTAPLSTLGYSDGQQEETIDPELPNCPDGSIDQCQSAPTVQPSAPQVPQHQEITTDTSIEKLIEAKQESTLSQENEPTPAHSLQVIDTTDGSELMNRIRKAGHAEVPLSQRACLDIESPEVKVRGAREIEPSEKPKKNIIALTKGFLEKLQGVDGSDAIDRNGDPNQRPSFEELRFIGYESKINWALQASWKQNFEHSIKHKATTGTVDISFLIDAQGNPCNITIIQSSGIEELDRMIIHNIQNASPYPPIPAHFHMTEYPVRRSIRVYAYGKGC